MHPIIKWTTTFFLAMVFVYIMNIANLIKFLLTGEGQLFILYSGITMFFLEQYVISLVKDIDLESL
jgi:hypothetical protein